MERVFLSWVSFSSRSQLLSDTFNARPFYIKYLTKKTFLNTVIRYVVATFHTFVTLFRARPTFIFLMNQPVFLPMVVFCYSKVTKSTYVLDSHSGLFNKRVWRTFIPLMKPVYRACLLNIAHNNHDAEKYRAWGARTTVLGTEIYSYDCYARRCLETTNNIVVIGKYAVDEPVEEVVAAASGLEDVNFYFTGPIENARKRMEVKRLARNVILTGFLPLDDFVGLVKAADAALVLVTTDNTMQMGAWEAMSCGTPVILSDWELLRSTFPKGAVFVQNTKQGIQRGIRTFFENKDRLKRDIVRLRLEKEELWEKEVEAIENVLKSYQ